MFQNFRRKNAFHAEKKTAFVKITYDI